MSNLEIFKQEYLPAETSATTSYNKWKASNPGEFLKWDAYLNAVLAGQAVQPPALKTNFGKKLVAVAKMAASQSTPANTTFGNSTFGGM